MYTCLVTWLYVFRDMLSFLFWPWSECRVSTVPLFHLLIVTMSHNKIQVSIIAFAAAKDILWSSGLTSNTDELNKYCVHLEKNWTTGKELRSYICHQLWPMLSDIECSIVLARNLCYVDLNQEVILHNQDVLALIPPISGGWFDSLHYRFSFLIFNCSGYIASSVLFVQQLFITDCWIEHICNKRQINHFEVPQCYALFLFDLNHLWRLSTDA